jgi:integrase/recombinase XerD
MPIEQPDLFGEASIHAINEWDRDPIATFTKFVQSEDFVATGSRGRRGNIATLSSKSANIYIDMFRKFTRWLELDKKKFSALTAEDLMRFLELGKTINNTWVPDLDSAIKQRYLRLIERCFLALHILPNPAQHALFNAMRTEKLGTNLDAVCLNDEQVIQFCLALPPLTLGKTHWKWHRNRVMQIVMLYSGLRVAEVIGLQTEEISRQGVLDGCLPINIQPIHKHDTSHPHTTTIQAIAVPEVLQWLKVREELNIGGTRLFPNEQGGPLKESTLYRQVSNTFTRAKIDLPRLGGRTLRNTFAAGQLRSGISLNELREQLGLALARSAAAYLTLAKKIQA